ncbi:MAG TPA: hypothetical protein VLI54_06575 [Bacillota bacterium]|nr:hypothetical protein [Bacillota bacterium]
MSKLQARRALHRVNSGFFAFFWALTFGIAAITPAIAWADPPNKQVVSADANGTVYTDEETNPAWAFRPMVSADGSIIAFSSSARLTASAPARRNTAYVYNLRTHHIIWNTQHLASDTETGSSHAYAQDISADGRLVLFYGAGDQVGDNAGPGLFVHNLETGDTTRVSIAPDGSPVTRMEDVGAFNGSLSPNGHYLAFTALVFDETGGHAHTYVRDLVAHTTSELSAGVDSGDPQVSNDGRYVAFRTQDEAYHPVAVYDRTLDALHAPNNTPQYSDAGGIMLAPDGSSVVYYGTPDAFSGQPSEDGPGTHVFRMTIPGDVITDITPTTDINLFSQTYGGFSPDGSRFTFKSQLPLTGDTTARQWGVYSYDVSSATYTFIDLATDNTWYYIGGGSSDISDNGDVAVYIQSHESVSSWSNVYARTFNGWTPPTPAWTPQPWDDTAPDTTAPVISPNFDPNAWYNTPQTFTFTCTDPGNGISASPPPQTVSSEGYTEVKSRCEDAQGNRSAYSYWTAMLDFSGPVVDDFALEAKSPDGVTFHSADVIYDSLSGVATTSCDTPENTLLAAGDHVMTCTATDNAANTTTNTVTVTVTPYHQPTMGIFRLGKKTHNRAGNDKTVVTVSNDTLWGDTVVLTASVGAQDGNVKCKDSKGNAYQKIADRTTVTGRIVQCAGTITDPLLAGDTVTVTYPSYDGVSVVTVDNMQGLDTPGEVTDKAYKEGTGTAASTNKVIPTGTRFIVYGVHAWSGNATLTNDWSGLPISDIDSPGDTYAGGGAARRNIEAYFQVVRGNPESFYKYTGTYSKNTSWQSFLSLWAGQNSGRDPD